MSNNSGQRFFLVVAVAVAVLCFSNVSLVFSGYSFNPVSANEASSNPEPGSVVVRGASHPPPKRVIQAHERPPCGSACLYLYWTGRPTMPPMYQACLESAVKAFGKENVVVVSSVLSDQQEKSWFPVIWNLTTLDLAHQLVDDANLHTYEIWETFLNSLQSNAHVADFVRIALVYLYGGIYTDLDNLWIKPIPLQYPVVVDESSSFDPSWNGKTLFRVRVDKRMRGNKVISTNNYNHTHNAVVGGMRRSNFHRRVMEVMPKSYDAKNWVSIGDAILIPAVTYCNCIQDFVEIEYINMYGIYGGTAPKYYNKPLDPNNNENDKKLVEHVLKESHQLHLFGSKTKSTEKLPVDGSLYRILLDHLKISVA